MNSSLSTIFGCCILLVLMSMGCRDINDLTSSDSVPAIKSVIPAKAPYGAPIKIGGTGFGDDLSDQKVIFNNTLAEIEALNDTAIQTRVPFGANTGPLLVVANGDTLQGPSFTVDTTGNSILFIESIDPIKGRVGAEITISGKGFKSNPEENKVLFNTISAPVLSANDSVITTTVPPEAQTGPVTVVADQDTAVGPTFTVVRQSISAISPQAGPVGTSVTITGSGFSDSISDNTVTFGGTEGLVEMASENELLAVVPEMATTGPVAVSIAGYTVSGPTFTVQQPKSLQVVVQTEGTRQDEGYTLSVTGRENRVLAANDEALYTGIYENSVEVALTDIAENCRVEGENPRNVSLTTGSVTNTNFTVDCTTDLRGKIVFTSDRHNYGELYVQDETTPFVLRITESIDYYEAEPAISPDGLKIAFSNNKGGGRHILVMDSDGSDVKQLTDSGYNGAPSWSPDGSEIVFVRSSNSDAPSDIFIMDSDGNNLRNITNTSTAREFNPDWSPDGSRIVYESFLETDTEIFTIDPEGNNEVQITDNEVFDMEPEWSPSGDRIAFVRNLMETGQNVHIMNSDGTGASKLTYFNGTERSPTWSPDGSMIAFSRYVDGYYHINIFSVDYNDILASPYTSSNDRSPHWNYK